MNFHTTESVGLTTHFLPISNAEALKQERAETKNILAYLLPKQLLFSKQTMYIFKTIDKFDFNSPIRNTFSCHETI